MMSFKKWILCVMGIVTASVMLRADGETPPAIANPINSMTFSPNRKQFAAAGDNGDVRVWTVPEFRLERTLHGNSHINALAFSPDGSVLTGNSDGTVRLWEAQTGKETRTISRKDDWIRALTFSPDGSTLACATFVGWVELWNVKRAHLQRKMWEPSNGMSGVAFSPTGADVATAGGSLKVWDADTGKPKWDSRKGCLALAFSPDGSQIVSDVSNTGRIMVFDAQTGQVRRVLNQHKASIRALAFSPDGRLLASGSDDGTVMLWDAQSGKMLRTLKGQAGARSLAFAPDGETLATGWENGRIKLWETTTGRCLRTF